MNKGDLQKMTELSNANIAELFKGEDVMVSVLDWIVKHYRFRFMISRKVDILQSITDQKGKWNLIQALSKHGWCPG